MRINDSLVAGQQIAQREIMRRLRGKRGSEVRLGLERRGIDELVEVTVVRDKIPIRSLTAALMLTGDIAFVKLDQFARTSHTELLEALSTLRTQGMRKLILDLRGNSGGFLDQAIAIANEFLPADKLIVYTEDRNHQRIEQYSDGTGSAADLDLAVLVDEGSASSSEILAGALQDNDRGTIIGRRSFGKGLVQRRRFGAAADRRPLLHPHGALDPETLHLGRRRELRRRHLEPLPAQRVLLGRFDPFRRRAAPHNAGRQGGLRRRRHHARHLRTARHDRPDQILPRSIGTQHSLPLYDRIRRRPPQGAQRRPDDADRGLVDDFIRYAARKGVAPRYGDIARSRQLMEAQLKAYIGRNTSLEDSGYFLSIYPEDEVIVRAIGELEHPTIPTVKAAEAVAEGEPAEEQPAEEEPAEEAPHD